MDLKTLERAKKCACNIGAISVDLKTLEEMLDSDSPYIQFDKNSISRRYIRLDTDAKNKVYNILKTHLTNKKKKLEKELASL